MCRQLFWRVERQDFDGVGYLVWYALTSRMERRPKLQILKAVIVSSSIDVVNRLVWFQPPAKMFLHDQAMLVILPTVHTNSDVSVLALGDNRNTSAPDGPVCVWMSIFLPPAVVSRTETPRNRI